MSMGWRGTRDDDGVFLQLQLGPYSVWCWATRKMRE